VTTTSFSTTAGLRSRYTTRSRTTQPASNSKATGSNKTDLNKIDFFICYRWNQLASRHLAKSERAGSASACLSLALVLAGSGFHCPAP
jgi:hypothetical protein